MWGYTSTEIIPWVEYQRREILFREAVLAFLGVKPAEPEVEEEKKTIGWFCNGSSVEECSKMFGAALSKVCKTCPE